jgi:hypothetical protein
VDGPGRNCGDRSVVTRKRKPPAEQLGFGFPGHVPVCVCGHPRAMHCNRGAGGCQTCLECRKFALSAIATYSAEARAVLEFERKGAK